MSNEIRVRANYVSGTLNGALTNVATSMSAAGLANLPVVGATQHAVLSIENEIVWVTAHTGGATTATILRGQEGTVAAAHSSAVAWVHGPVASDFYQVLGYAQAVASQSGITTETDLTSLTTTVTVPYAGHRVRIMASVQLTSTVANDYMILRVKEGATVLTSGQVTVGATAGAEVNLERSVVIVPTAASHTYKLSLARSAGTGTVSSVATATEVAFILVEDLGPAA